MNDAGLSDLDRTAHLLRRFGLGAGRYELRRYGGKGWKSAASALIDESAADEGFALSPWRFCRDEAGKSDPNAYRIIGWWALRMLMTRRPAQEKLTLFWHDHFAVDAEKVSEAPTMIGYLDVLREMGRGSFRELLHAVSKQGALVQYLDAVTSHRIKPNENFAREMLELFTVGEGKFSERDVQDAARAFTGWSMHYLGLYTDVPYDKLREAATRERLAVNNFAFVPALHDAGIKTVLGKTGPLTGDDVLDHLAGHEDTAESVSRKLWEWLAYPNPEDEVVERLTAAWKRNGGKISAVLRAIVDTPEFFSERAVRTKPKSPVDWTVALFRALDLGDVTRQMVDRPDEHFAPVRKELTDAAGALSYLMTQQGMTLLFPPNVGGWEWGDAWLTSSTTLVRLRHAELIFWGGGDERPLATAFAERLRQDGDSTTTEGIVDGLVDIFDGIVDQPTRALLIEACEAHGGAAALGDKDRAANLFTQLAKLLFGTPNFQLG